MSLEQQIATEGGAETVTPPDVAEQQTAPRDYEAEARSHGWTPKEEFKGDPDKWVDAETFARRADEVMPFLKKQNAALKRDLDDLRKQAKKAAEYFSKGEERAYARALADLESKMEEAVDTGDKAAAKRVMADMEKLKAERVDLAVDEPVKEFDPAEAQRELAAWVEQNDWYVLDESKRKYADMQAALMGPAKDWPDGSKAYLDELAKRVDRKFSEKPPAQTSGGGNRATGGKTGRGYADLPPEAKRMCDKWVSNGLIKSREDYVKSYQWD